MSEFTYDTLDAAQVAAIQETAVAPAVEPTLDYASLLPAWEADHAGHVALLAQAKADGDEEAIRTHEGAIATLEAAILDGRAKL